MAKATTKTETKKVVTLELTEDEATALRVVTGSIGGVSDLRVHTTAVYEALGKAGILSATALGTKLSGQIKTAMQTQEKPNTRSSAYDDYMRAIYGPSYNSTTYGLFGRL
jgi:hypothetical protein